MRLPTRILPPLLNRIGRSAAADRRIGTGSSGREATRPSARGARQKDTALTSQGLRRPIKGTAGGWLVPLIAVTALSFAPFLGGGMLTDDFVHLSQARTGGLARPFITPDPFGFYRPLPQLSFAVE